MRLRYSDSNRPTADFSFTLFLVATYSPTAAQSEAQYFHITRAALCSLCLGVDALFSEQSRYCISHTIPIPSPRLSPLAFGCVTLFVALSLHIAGTSQQAFTSDCGKG